jgi:tripartite-type tricarboxylate transporter receptor subunit TctC
MALQRRQFLKLAASAAALPAFSLPAPAQAYPTRHVTLVVPYAAGGSADTLPRIIAEHMRGTFGTPIVIENITGAAGSIGAGRVARAAADGYTFGLGNWSTHVANGVVYALPYDVRSDFESIIQIVSSPLLIAARKDVPANTLGELVAWLKAHPGRSQGTNGPGSIMHLAGVLLQNETGARLNFVPYRGSAPAMQDLLQGHIDVYIGLAADIVPQAQAGRIKVYAVTGKNRLVTAPDIPTVDEAGLLGLYVSAWFGFWAPKGTPKQAIASLNRAAVAALADPGVRRRLQQDLSFEIPPPEQQTPEALHAYQMAEIGRWWPLIQAANIKAE